MLSPKKLRPARELRPHCALVAPVRSISFRTFQCLYLVAAADFLLETFSPKTVSPTRFPQKKASGKIRSRLDGEWNYLERVCKAKAKI